MCIEQTHANCDCYEDKQTRWLALKMSCYIFARENILISLTTAAATENLHGDDLAI
jgi:hypothetical protein